MEQVTVTLTPLNSSNPTITRTTSENILTLPTLRNDTYTVKITSSVYSTYETQVVINGDTTINIHLEVPIVQTVEWRQMQTVTTIPITTRYVDDPTINQGVEIVDSAGTQGKTTFTWEAEYVDGVATGNTRNSQQSTVPMVQRVVRRGTKVEQQPLVNVLTANNVSATYGANTYVNNERTEDDAIPIGNSGIFELRQWDGPSAGMIITDNNLQPNKQYTLAFELENIGPVITKAHFTIGMSFFGGKHFFNGVERSVPPNAGEYLITAFIPTSGKTQYHFQFTTEPSTPVGDEFIIHIDNGSNNTIVRYSKLNLYQGFVNPYV